MSVSPEKNRSAQRTVLLGSVILLLLLTGVQIGLYLYGYEFAADLYLPGALPTVTALVWIAAAAGAFLLALPLPGKTACQELKLPSSHLTDYAALLSMASLVSTVILPLMNRHSNDPLGTLLSSTDISDNTARTMLIASLILAVCAALHFLLQFVHRKITPLGVTAVMLWAGVSALRIYFDMRYLLMSPRRVLHLVALVAVLLFFIAELRLARGIATFRFYTLAAAPAMIFAGCDAITNLLLSAMGFITLGSEICTYFVLLAVAIYGFARLLALASPPTKRSEEVTSTEIYAETALTEESPDQVNSPDLSAEESPDQMEESPE